MAGADPQQSAGALQLIGRFRLPCLGPDFTVESDAHVSGRLLLEWRRHNRSSRLYQEESEGFKRVCRFSSTLTAEGSAHHRIIVSVSMFHLYGVRRLGSDGFTSTLDPQ